MLSIVYTSSHFLITYNPTYADLFDGANINHTIKAEYTSHEHN